jgi:hypothetical protein
MSTIDEKKKLIDNIAGLMFSYIPMSKLPECCKQRAENACKKYGMCGEVLRGAFDEALREVLLDEKLED